MGKLKVILDMDGVIADFTAGMCATNGIPFDPNNYRFPIGLWDYVCYMERVFGLEWSKVSEQCSNPQFWFDLPLIPGAKKLYEALCVDYDVSFMTKTTGDVSEAFDGKRAWLEKHGFATPHDKRMLLLEHGESKGDYARDDAVLIDDMDANVQDFIKAGGHGIVIPRPWNNRHFDFVSYEQANSIALENLYDVDERIRV